GQGLLGEIDQAGQGGVDERGTDVLTPSGGSRAKQGPQDAHGRVEAGEYVAQCPPHLAGRSLDRSGGAHQPALGLYDDVETRTRGGGVFGAEPTYRAVHDGGVAGADLLVTQPEPVDDPGTEVLDDHVGVCAQVLYGGQPVGVLQVHGQAAFVPVHRQEIGGFTG